MLEQVRSLASDIFDVPREKISAESSPERLTQWDSVRHLSLVLALEEKFRCQLSPEEIEQMRNIGEVVRVLERKLPPSAGGSA